ncbi:hypothetical protein [Halobaculum marinum]|uniref:Nuclease-related domain-containing protein n=1 Tax=Halobaculum marinum TaxID=3031996 RepID=A0ABD5X2R8_9EURY|nr:hypothetical protein [Halobaculum sp. DT55]
MKNCELCGKPTKSHTARDIAICHSCYTEEDIAKSLLAEAEGKAEEDEMDEVFEQLPKHETEDAFYTDLSPLYDSLRDSVDDMRDATPPPDDVIQELRDLLGKADTRQLIGSLGENFVGSATIAVDPDTHEDGVGIPPKMIEYLLGLVCTIDPSEGGEVPYDDIHDTTDKLTQSLLFQLVDDDVDIKSLSEEEQQQHFIEGEVLTRELTAGRFVYPGQFLDAAERAYTPHNNVLKDELGFTIQEAIQFATELSQLYNGRYQQMMDHFQEFGRISRTMHGSFVRHVDENKNDAEGAEAYLESDEFEEARQEAHNAWDRYEEAKRCLWVAEETLLGQFSDNEYAFKAFLERMSVTVGSVPEANFTYPYEHNPLHASPILEDDASYIIPHFHAFLRALAETFYYDLIDLPGYGSQDQHGGEFGEKWGDYVEGWAHDSLRNLFPDDAIYLNPTYTVNGDDYETDLVIIHEDTCLVIECKTQKLTLPTRRGDYQRVKDDVLDGIGDGHDQAARLIDHIQDGTVTELKTNGGTECIDTSSIDDVLPIVVLREQYDWIATTEYGTIADIDDDLSYVVSVYDLEVITECLESPDRFTDYVTKRIELSRTQKLASPDELDYLGAYIDNDLEVIEFEDDLRVQMTDFAHIVEDRVGNQFYPDELGPNEIFIDEPDD